MTADTLAGQFLLSLRPVGEHAPLRRASAPHGLRVIALSPWKLLLHDDAATRTILYAALQADIVICTSPAAVTAVQRLQPLCMQAGQTWVAVGTGTAQRLRRAGIRRVNAPHRMDSEGLLALPELRDVRGTRIGLITAPGGRGLIASSLQQRGATLLRADVYRREVVRPTAAALAQLETSAPLWLALTSQGALDTLWESLSDPQRQCLCRARAVAASARLARHADMLGFSSPIQASDTRPAQLVRAILDAVSALRVPSP